MLFGHSEGGPSSVLLAARGRSDRLAGPLRHVRAHLVAAAAERMRRRWSSVGGGRLTSRRRCVEHWGDGARLDVFAPERASEQRRCARSGARRRSPRHGPGADRARAGGDRRARRPGVGARADARAAPRGRPRVPVEAGRLLAERHPRGALRRARRATDHAFWFGDSDPIVDEIERFVTGAVHRAEPDRVLATVLFTDIVGSTSARRSWATGAGARCSSATTRSSTGRRRARRAGRQAHRRRGAVGLRRPGDGDALRRGAARRGARARHRAAGRHPHRRVRGDRRGPRRPGRPHRRSGRRAGGRRARSLVSSTVKELVVGSDMQFTDRGEHELKGVPGSWRLYALGEERTPLAELDGAAGHMRRSDRVAVTLARRAPGQCASGQPREPRHSADVAAPSCPNRRCLDATLSARHPVCRSGDCRERPAPTAPRLRGPRHGPSTPRSERPFPHG